MSAARPGRWMVGALIVGAAVLLALRIRDGDAPPRRTFSAEREVDPQTQRASRRRAPTPDAGRVDPAAVGMIVVRVLAQEDATPIEGATVVCPDAPEGDLRGTTDAAGVARFGPFEWHYRWLRASAPGRESRGEGDDQGSDEDDEVVIRLAAGAELTVRVEGDGGAPVSGARVFAYRQDLSTQDHGETDGDGRFRTSSPFETPLEVTAEAKGYDSAAVELTSARRGESSPEVVLRLPRPGRLTGVVRGPDGEPIADARVTVAPEEIPLEFRRYGFQLTPADEAQIHATSDSDGRYSVPGLSHGARYHARAEGQADLLPSAAVEGLKADSNVDLVLRRPTTLVVHVVDENGAAVPDPSVTLHRSSGLDDGFNSLTPDASGVFRVGGLYPGERCLVEAWKSGARTASFAFETPAQTTFDVVLTMAPPATLSGTVVNDLGAPVRGAEVRVAIASPDFGLRVFHGATTGASGGFEVSLAGAGRRRVEVGLRGHLPTVVDLPTPSDDARIVLRRAAVIVFRIPGDYDLRGNVDAGFAGETRVFRMDRESDGEYRVELEPRGETELRLFAYGRAPIVRRVSVAPGVLDLGDLALEKPAELKGRVVDGDGRPVSGAYVSWGLSPEFFGSLPLCRTDEDGRFHGALAPAHGFVPLEVTSSRFLAWHASVSVDSPVVVALARGGLVHGQMVDAAGAPERGEVQILDDAGRECATTTVDECGFFSVRVPPGRLRVRADDCDDVAVTLVEGGDERVRLVLRR